MSLEHGEIKGFVYRQLENEKEIANKIIQSIENAKGKYIHSFLKNPLLLSLYILTFQSYASIPDKKYIFYRRVINALFSEHDSKTKLGFVREKLCGLNQEQFEDILKAFSFISYFENKFDFETDYVYDKLKAIKERKKYSFDNEKFILDLKSAIGIWVDDEGQLSFTHRSLQEYFAASFIKELKEQENTRVYEKIISKLGDHDLIVREIENLLTLLEEMDTFNYFNNYYIKILNELAIDIDVNNNITDEYVKKYINYFTEGISIKFGHIQPKSKRKSLQIDGKNLHLEFSPSVKESVYRGIQVHFLYTQKLHRYLVEKLNENLREKLISGIDIAELVKDNFESANKLNSFVSLIFFENDVIPQEVWNELYTSELIDLANEFRNFIILESQKANKLISTTKDTEKDMVDLI